MCRARQRCMRAAVLIAAVSILAAGCQGTFGGNRKVAVAVPSFATAIGGTTLLVLSSDRKYDQVAADCGDWCFEAIEDDLEEGLLFTLGATALTVGLVGLVVLATMDDR